MLQGEVEVKGSVTRKYKVFWLKLSRASGRPLCAEASRVEGKVDRRRELCLRGITDVVAGLHQ